MADQDDIVFALWPDGGIDFVPNTKSYGNAEFLICLRYERGKIHRVFISRLQQEAEGDWVYELEAPRDAYHISGFVYIREPARVWEGGWCSFHKAPFMRMYPPRDTNHLDLRTNGSGLDIRFSMKEEKV